MPKNATGGTKMFCPNCKTITVCMAYPKIGYKGPTDQRARIGGIKYFKRWRRCLTCEKKFNTAEIPENLVKELLILRHVVRELDGKLSKYRNRYMTKPKAK